MTNTTAQQRPTKLHYSSAYVAGYERAKSRAEYRNTSNLTPSIGDRNEFDADWRAFMMGWGKGLHDAGK